MQLQTKPSSSKKSAEKSTAAPNLTKIQSHARQIQEDLDAIKSELDAMKDRFMPAEPAEAEPSA